MLRRRGGWRKGEGIYEKWEERIEKERVLWERY